MRTFPSELPCILLSLDYRLAPENRLPVAYDDSVELLCWLKQQAMDPNSDPWLRDYADFSRCYIMGTSSGANIAYRTDLCSSDLDLEPVKIAGIIFNQPFFGGEVKTESEIALANDEGTPLLGTYTNKIGKLPKVLISGIEGDPFLDRQMELVAMLIRNGVQITAYFDDIGFHCVDYLDPKHHLRMITYLREFMDICNGSFFEDYLISNGHHFETFSPSSPMDIPQFPLPGLTPSKRQPESFVYPVLQSKPVVEQNTRKRTSTSVDDQTINYKIPMKKLKKQKKMGVSTEDKQPLSNIQEHKAPIKRSQKIVDRITTLQKLVSPYGKADTASVLQQASAQIKYLHEKIQQLSKNYMDAGRPHPHIAQESEVDPRSRGLCIVPMSLAQKLPKEDQD
ncbi:hypothetical protein GIB67_012298 [Kingdonia uniflora]|uniref:Alpha/beta hydrolase fold-3 domain-containing protein n=1 Tax=Kingdonia uniflora TaxID=39325 RepID=A0A7J7MVC7_9MAGN|nr:hypothetical protein GIB67_012298 [Kingdonia uniflora]